MVRPALGRSTTLRRVIDGFGQATEMESSFPPLFVIDQKGEHRGLAWKYKWQVLAFAADSQAQEFRVPVVVIEGGLHFRPDRIFAPRMVPRNRAQLY